MDELFELIPVTGEDGDSVTDDVTTESSETSGDNTSGTTSDAATSDAAGSGGTTDDIDYKKQFLELQASKERDVAAVKSSHQKQLADQKKEFDRQMAEIKLKIEEMKFSQMDEEDRKVFLQNKKEQEQRSIIEERETYKQKLSELEQMQAYEQFALSDLGLDPKILKRENPATLSQSIWDAVKSKLSEQQKLIDKLQKSSKTSGAPDVNTNLDKLPAKSGASMSDLIKRYGSEEEVYKALEDGKIRPEDFPV